ncbi:MAG: hypothetical protein ACRD5L_11470 [Bryobacteraceae bacterium]
MVRLVFTAAPRGQTGTPLVPEQAAQFDLRLGNQGEDPQTANSLTGLLSPRIRLLDDVGQVLRESTPADASERTSGGLARSAISPASQVTLAPGQVETAVVDLWSHTSPPPPGKYAFEAEHTGITSNRVSFEVVAGRVEDSALSFGNPRRTRSVLAWLAAPAGAATSRLLIRISGSASHAVAQLGAVRHGEFPLHSRVAVSATPTDGVVTPVGWVAVVCGDGLQLIQHNLSEPQWRAALVPLPVGGAVPVPRFPDRRNAVFLATGSGPEGPVLVGVKIRNGETAPKVWSVKLSVTPQSSACAFMMQGAITLLFANDNGQRARLSRMDITEDGKVVAREHVIRETSNEVLAVTTDSRPGTPLGFVAMEADRARHHRATFVRIPLKGEPQVTPPQELAGWPPVTDRGPWRPDRPRLVALETAADGTPWIALVDAQGNLTGGPISQPLALLREALHEGKAGPVRFPHIAVLDSAVTISAFSEDGSLFHSGDRLR